MAANLSLPERPAHLQREVFAPPLSLVAHSPVVGWSRFDRAGPHLQAHVHEDCFELCYIVHGTVEWWVRDEVYKVAPHQVFVTRPGEVHGGVDAFMHPCELYWVHLRPAGRLGVQCLALPRVIAGTPGIETLFARILSEHRLAALEPARRAEARRGASAALDLLVLEASRCSRSGAHHDSLVPAAIARAMRVIRAQFASPNCLLAAAKASHLGSTQFRINFGKATGFTPQEYLTLIQVEEGKRRLGQTCQPITTIALDVGYSSSQYFATVFRKMVGLSPGEYRRKHADPLAIQPVPGTDSTS